MAKIKHRRTMHFRVRHVVIAAFMLIALYVIVPQADQFGKAFQAARHADIWLIIAAAGAIAWAIASSAMVYVWLALKPLRYVESLLVQAAGMFVNRLLPAGIGGMGLSADYLYKHGHNLAKASTIVLINNVLTFLGHMSLLLFAIIFLHATLPDIHVPHIASWAYLMAGVVVVLVIFALQSKVAKLLRQFLTDLAHSAGLYGRQKRKLMGAFVFALGNTLGHATAIYLSMQAFHVDLPFTVALVVLTGGVAAASVTPTPGGLVGSEAGLTAVLVGYDVETSTALAVALSYRLVSYWLPLLPGALAFWIAQAKKVI
jgi:uncharacterized membrane protein YbhN (UPF0104 family)